MTDSPSAPEMTVLLPVYNGARHLRASIDSVLAQTFGAFELLVVDDGSTDETSAVLASYADRRLRVIRHERNRGLSAALNRGLEEARGQLVARQDADDLSDASRLARQRAFLETHPTVALVGSQAAAIDDDGRPLKPVDRSLDAVSIRWYGLFDNPFIHTSVMFRRRVVWEELGGFDAACDPYSQDYALWMRVMRGHDVANLPERLVTYRVHGSSIIGALEDVNDKAGHRVRFDTIVRTLVVRHIRTMFGVDEIGDADVALMPGFVLGVPAPDTARFLAAFRRLLDLYVARHPEARASGEFSRVLARQFDAIAYRLVGGSRRDVLSVYRAALAEGADVLWRLSWMRACALVALGRRGRARLGQSAPARAVRAMRSP